MENSEKHTSQQNPQDNVSEARTEHSDGREKGEDKESVEETPANASQEPSSTSSKQFEKKRVAKQTQKLIEKLLLKDRAKLQRKMAYEKQQENLKPKPQEEKAKQTPDDEQNEMGTRCENCNFKHDLLEIHCHQYRQWIKQDNDPNAFAKRLEVTNLNYCRLLMMPSQVSRMMKKYKVFIQEESNKTEQTASPSKIKVESCPPNQDELEPERASKFLIFGSQNQLDKVQMDLEFKSERLEQVEFKGIKLRDKDISNLKQFVQKRFSVLLFTLKVDLDKETISIKGQDQEEIARFIASILTRLQEANFPATWRDKIPLVLEDHTVARYFLHSESSEYKSIEQRFHETVQNKIISIIRVENLLLWRKFQIEAKNLRRKLNREPEEKLLWHGFRAIDSNVITQGEEGFDMRFSRGGRFGRGNYFAVNANYSTQQKFVHQNPDKTKEVLLARVLIGDPAKSVDQNQNMPPLKEDGTVRYDSVTDSQNMYVVYSNSKAYPQYLITFQE